VGKEEKIIQETNHGVGSEEDLEEEGKDQKGSLEVKDK